VTGELTGIHVLIVEDTDDTRELFKMVLEYCGALVTAAASVEQAVTILETLRPHVMVTDIGRPEDGVALVRHAKAIAHTKGIHVPAIAVTAYHGRREELLAEGFVELVEKPLDPRTLCGVVREYAAV